MFKKFLFKRFLSVIFLLTQLVYLHAKVDNRLTCLPNGKKFDVIIMGLGNAGCVLANRLSEDPDIEVLVIDGGRDETKLTPLLPLDAPEPTPNKVTSPWNQLIRLGAAAYNHLGRTGFQNWEHVALLRETVTPPTTAEHNTIWTPKCATWGGCTAHNFTVAFHGAKQVYDEWNLPLWTFNQIIDLGFKKFEGRRLQTNPHVGEASPMGFGDNYWTTASGFSPTTDGTFVSDFMGATGPVPIIRQYWEDPLAKALKVSASIQGIPINNNPDNPNSELGLASTPLTVLDQAANEFEALNTPFYGRHNPATFPPATYDAVGFGGFPAPNERVSAQMAYIYPIENRKNLTVLSETLVTKVIFDDNKRAVGVEYLSGYNIYQTGRRNNTVEAGLGGTPQDAENNARMAKKKGVKTALARLEVILCGGVYNSPQTLMLSGIGPKAHLKDKGIKVIQDLPGVGQNMQDHAEIDITWRMRQRLNPWNYILPNLTAPGFAHQSLIMTMHFKSNPTDPLLRYYNFHVHIYNGAFSSGGGSGFTDIVYSGRLDPFSSVPNPTPPPLTLEDPQFGGNGRNFGPPQYIFPPDQIVGNPQTYAPGVPQSDQIAHEPMDFRFHTSILLEQLSFVKSRGFVRLRSCDPTEQLDIVANLLQDPEDLARHIEAFRDVIVPFVERLGTNSATFFREGGPVPGGLPFSTVPNPAGPGFFDDWVRPTRAEFQTAGVFDETKYKTFLLNHLWSHHTSGTCKMVESLKKDPMGVVDQRGKVFGVEGLRVVDASLFPIIPAANTASPVYALSERMSLLIKEDLACAKKKRNR